MVIAQKNFFFDDTAKPKRDHREKNTHYRNNRSCIKNNCTVTINVILTTILTTIKVVKAIKVKTNV